MLLATNDVADVIIAARISVIFLPQSNVAER